MIFTLARVNIIYAQEQKNMLVVTKEMPMKIAISRDVLKIYFFSIMIQLIKHYLTLLEPKVTLM